jgi:hypothetical protein
MQDKITPEQAKENMKEAKKLILKRFKLLGDLKLTIKSLVILENETNIGRDLEHLVHVDVEDKTEHRILTNREFIQLLVSDKEEVEEELVKLRNVAKNGYWVGEL